jgi:hypothetical protein
VLEGFSDVADELIVLDVALIVEGPDHEALVLLDLADVLDDALVELLVLHVLDVGDLNLLDLLVLQVAAAQLAVVLREVQDLLVRPEPVL